MTADTGQLACSFCGKTAPEVSKLIAGPGIYICDECVGKCADILEAEEVPSHPELPEWQHMSDDEILAHLPRIAAVSAQADRGLGVRIAGLRDRGVTWTRIGEALGMTRQSAWERFAGRGQAAAD